MPEYCFLSFGFSILPVGFRGTSPKNIFLGLLYFGSGSQNSRTSSSVNVLPGFISITTATISPRRSSGRPMAAASLIFGWVWKKSSTSTGKTFSPPVMMMSFFRSTSQMKPSSSSAGHVAGEKPAVDQGFLCGFRVFVVFTHNAVAADAELARLALGNDFAVFIDDLYIPS